MKFFLIFVFSYLLGSVCASIPLSKRRCGTDIRLCGSGNAGATNVARVFGLKAGLITLACDMAKTVAAMLLGRHLAGDAGMAIAAVGCIIGHCLPVFFGFRGGKGVSVGAAIAAMNGWRFFLILMAVFFLAAVLSRKVSLGSICAALALIITAFLLRVSTPMLIADAFSGALVVFMHRSNIKRLLNGTEADFKANKIKPS